MVPQVPVYQVTALSSLPNWAGFTPILLWNHPFAVLAHLQVHSSLPPICLLQTWCRQQISSTAAALPVDASAHKRARLPLHDK